MQTILLVEKKDRKRSSLAPLLETAGYAVEAAADGQDGILRMRRSPPDLVICDMDIKGVDGLGMLHVMQQEGPLQLVPAILLMNDWDPRRYREAMQLGADDVMVRPFSGAGLLQTVAVRLEKRHLLLQNAAAIDPSDENDFRNVVRAFITDRNTVRLAPHEVIYREGETPRYMFYIISGKVKTVKTHEDGKDLLISLYNTGDFFGYIALLEEERYKATALAMDETELALIPRKDAEEMLGRVPLIFQKFVKMLARNLTEKENRLVGIAYDTLRKKVASALVHLRNKYHQGTGQYKVNIARDELASLAGTATESLIRTLGEFKQEKLIAIKGPFITLLEPGRLEDIAFH
ncbi:cyclic nucleotide-binding domain-containing protein [Chitinophaga sp. NPDC101104]|uniref:Crp/Fnr family transcriptional regulator n=1 Tax=Chitinophaga sp. NPDC101104 TaxID=3390561 RepID=UPI003D06B6B3